jgi:hypothetical protein
MTKSKRWGKKFKDKRNWKIYDEELVLRGEFYFDFDFLENWDEDLAGMNKNKVGHPYKYPNSLFEYLSPLYCFLDSRKLEGALRKLSKYIIKLESCDHCTICERLSRLNLTVDIDKAKSYDAIFDSTGNRLTNRGEYIRHKWKVRRGWIKVSIVIDKKTKDLLDVEVSLEDVEDYELAKKHLKNLEDITINSGTGDGAYYREELYNEFEKRGIIPILKPRSDASPNGFDPMHRSVREFQKLGGYKGWRDKYEYGKRWHVEGKISSTKRCNGESVRMINQKNFLNEAKRKFIDYERMTKYAQKRIKPAG